jgi:hypothetical protein
MQSGSMPKYAQNAVMNQGMSGFNPQMMMGGIGGLLGGLFGDSGAPYGAAMDQYQQFGKKAENAQNPFFNAGKAAIPEYQKWLQNQSNPSGFINNLMGQYQASPYSQYLQQQAMRGGQNAASASGLMGSTPMMEQMQQNSANIASGDMNQWLQHVLGINTQYGQGQQSLMQGGQNSANALTNMYGNMGNQMGEAAYGREAGGQQDMWNTIGGIGSLAAMFL